MNNIKSFDDFIFEVKSEKEIVRDLARHLAFDKDIIKYLNTSRAKRKIGWRELLDSKLHGGNKDYINYLTKNMVADYNPQITGYVHVDDVEGDFDAVSRNDRRFAAISPEDQIADLNDRVGDMENILGIDPDDNDSLERVAAALDNAGYVRPEPEEDDEEE